MNNLLKTNLFSLTNKQNPIFRSNICFQNKTLNYSYYFSCDRFKIILIIVDLLALASWEYDMKSIEDNLPKKLSRMRYDKLAVLPVGAVRGSTRTVDASHLYFQYRIRKESGAIG